MVRRMAAGMVVVAGVRPEAVAQRGEQQRGKGSGGDQCRYKYLAAVVDGRSSPTANTNCSQGGTWSVGRRDAPQPRERARCRACVTDKNQSHCQSIDIVAAYWRHGSHQTAVPTSAQSHL